MLFYVHPMYRTMAVLAKGNQVMHGRNGTALPLGDHMMHLDMHGAITEGAPVMVTTVYGFADCVCNAG